MGRPRDAMRMKNLNGTALQATYKHEQPLSEWTSEKWKPGKGGKRKTDETRRTRAPESVRKSEPDGWRRVQLLVQSVWNELSPYCGHSHTVVASARKHRTSDWA